MIQKIVKDNELFKKDIKVLKKDNEVLKKRVDKLEEFKQFTKDATYKTIVINSVAELMLFCFHKQPQSQPIKPENSVDFYGNLTAAGKRNYIKLSQKFDLGQDERFYSEACQLIKSRTLAVHFPKLGKKLDVAKASFTIYSELKDELSLQFRYLENYEWIYENIEFK